MYTTNLRKCGLCYFAKSVTSFGAHFGEVIAYKIGLITEYQNASKFVKYVKQGSERSNKAEKAKKAQ